MASNPAMKKLQHHSQPCAMTVSKDETAQFLEEWTWYKEVVGRYVGQPKLDESPKLHKFACDCEAPLRIFKTEP